MPPPGKQLDLARRWLVKQQIEALTEELQHAPQLSNMVASVQLQLDKVFRLLSQAERQRDTEHRQEALQLGRGCGGGHGQGLREDVEAGLEGGSEEGSEAGSEAGLEAGLEARSEGELEKGLANGLENGSRQGAKQRAYTCLEKGLAGQGLRQGFGEALGRGLEQGLPDRLAGEPEHRSVQGSNLAVGQALREGSANIIEFEHVLETESEGLWEGSIHASVQASDPGVERQALQGLEPSSDAGCQGSEQRGVSNNSDRELPDAAILAQATAEMQKIIAAHGGCDFVKQLAFSYLFLSLPVVRSLPGALVDEFAAASTWNISAGTFCSLVTSLEMAPYLLDSLLWLPSDIPPAGDVLTSIIPPGHPLSVQLLAALRPASSNATTPILSTAVLHPYPPAEALASFFPNIAVSSSPTQTGPLALSYLAQNQPSLSSTHAENQPHFSSSFAQTRPPASSSPSQNKPPISDSNGIDASKLGTGRLDSSGAQTDGFGLNLGHPLVGGLLAAALPAAEVNAGEALLEGGGTESGVLVYLQVLALLVETALLANATVAGPDCPDLLASFKTCLTLLQVLLCKWREPIINQLQTELILTRSRLDQINAHCASEAVDSKAGPSTAHFVSEAALAGTKSGLLTTQSACEAASADSKFGQIPAHGAGTAKVADSTCGQVTRHNAGEAAEDETFWGGGGQGDAIEGEVKGGNMSANANSHFVGAQAGVPVRSRASRAMIAESRYVLALFQALGPQLDQAVSTSLASLNSQTLTGKTSISQTLGDEISNGQTLTGQTSIGQSSPGQNPSSANGTSHAANDQDMSGHAMTVKTATGQNVGTEKSTGQTLLGSLHFSVLCQVNAQVQLTCMGLSEVLKPTDEPHCLDKMSPVIAHSTKLQAPLSSLGHNLDDPSVSQSPPMNPVATQPSIHQSSPNSRSHAQSKLSKPDPFGGAFSTITWREIIYPPADTVLWGQYLAAQTASTDAVLQGQSPALPAPADQSLRGQHLAAFPAPATSVPWAASRAAVQSVPVAVQRLLALAAAWLTPGMPCWWMLVSEQGGALLQAASCSFLAPELLTGVLMEMLSHALGMWEAHAHAGKKVALEPSIYWLVQLVAECATLVQNPSAQVALLNASLHTPHLLMVIQHVEGDPVSTESAASALITIGNQMVGQEEFADQVALSKANEAHRLAEAARKLLPFSLLTPSLFLDHMVAVALHHPAQQSLVIQLFATLRPIMEWNGAAGLDAANRGQDPPGDVVPKVLHLLHQHLIPNSSSAIVSKKAANAFVDLFQGLITAKLLSSSAVLDCVLRPALRALAGYPESLLTESMLRVLGDILGSAEQGEEMPCWEVSPVGSAVWNAGCLGALLQEMCDLANALLANCLSRGSLQWMNLHLARTCIQQVVRILKTQSKLHGSRTAGACDNTVTSLASMPWPIFLLLLPLAPNFFDTPWEAALQLLVGQHLTALKGTPAASIVARLTPLMWRMMYFCMASKDHLHALLGSITAQSGLSPLRRGGHPLLIALKTSPHLPRGSEATSIHDAQLAAGMDDGLRLAAHVVVRAVQREAAVAAAGQVQAAVLGALSQVLPFATDDEARLLVEQGLPWIMCWLCASPATSKAQESDMHKRRKLQRTEPGIPGPELHKSVHDFEEEGHGDCIRLEGSGKGEPGQPGPKTMVQGSEQEERGDRKRVEHLEQGECCDHKLTGDSEADKCSDNKRFEKSGMEACGGYSNSEEHGVSPGLLLSCLEACCFATLIFLHHSAWCKAHPQSRQHAAERCMRQIGNLVNSGIQALKPHPPQLVGFAQEAVRKTVHLIAELQDSINYGTLQNLLLCLVPEAILALQQQLYGIAAIKSVADAIPPAQLDKPGSMSDTSPNVEPASRPDPTSECTQASKPGLDGAMMPDSNPAFYPDVDHDSNSHPNLNSNADANPEGKLALDPVSNADAILASRTDANPSVQSETGPKPGIQPYMAAASQPDAKAHLDAALNPGSTSGLMSGAKSNAFAAEELIALGGRLWRDLRPLQIKAGSALHNVVLLALDEALAEIGVEMTQEIENLLG